MDRISKKKSEYRTPQDVREESYRTAKYIYLILLVVFVAVVLHYMFYDLYLLRGDGSVMSNRRSVTMEYDIKLKDIFIQNGDPVELGQIAFTYDSLDFRSKYSSVLSQYTKVSQEKHALENSISQLNMELGIESELGGFLENYLKKVTHLYGEKIIDINKIVSAKINHATSQKNREELKSQLETAQEARGQFVQATDELLSTLTYFKNTFANGTYHSEVTGIVGDLNAIPGDLIKMGVPIYTAYYNKRFIEVLFEESSVTYDLNDPVLVSVPEAGWVIGRIVDVGLYSPTLPEEIQPKYRPSGRRRLVRVLIDEKYLMNLEMRTLIKVYKPVGMEVACKFLNCKDHLLEEYRKYKEDEGLRPSQDHPY